MTDSFQTVTDKTNSLNSTAAACLDSLSGICLNGIIGLSSGPTPVLKSGLGSVHLAHVPLLPPIPISVPREPSLLASAPSRDPLARDACLLCHSLAPRRRFPSLFRWHVFPCECRRHRWRRRRCGAGTAAQRAFCDRSNAAWASDCQASTDCVPGAKYLPRTICCSGATTFVYPPTPTLSPSYDAFFFCPQKFSFRPQPIF